MALSRMDDFKVAFDPRTGKLRSASKPLAGTRALRVPGGGFNWRPLAICIAVAFALFIGIFLGGLVSELM